MSTIVRILSKFIERCVRNKKDSSKGYVLVLLCFLTPVLLLGGRWVLEYANKGKIFKKMDIEKRCAREVAIAVARNINPGLSLTDQKGTLLRIADTIYNEYPAHGFNKAPDAIPGLQSPIYEQKKKGKKYDPMVIGIKEYQSFAPDVKQVPYKKVDKYVYRVGFSGNANIGEVYRRVYFLKKNPGVTDECAIIDFLPYVNANGNVNVYSYCSFHQGADTNMHVAMPYLASSNFSKLQDLNYKERTKPNDSTVQIAIDRNRIKAKTDRDIAYAVPAECNVDIVITVPTNMAACNKNNKDEAPTVLSEDTRSIIENDKLYEKENVKSFRSTPIYQIAQAYHYFLQQFLHTRGTNVGIVPYSGKLSLPPDRADGWTQKFPAFSWSESKPNEFPGHLIGSILYGTVGIKDTSLTTQYDNWGEVRSLPEKHGGYGIMTRGNMSKEKNYANNYICHGDLLDNSNPSSYKFYRFNYNPCYITNASLLTMTSVADSQQYFHNPYFVVELQADIAKINDLMDVFVPFNDNNNSSNFIFLPLTWAQNLFQAWTKDPQQNSTGSSEELYRQSKLTNNRKKAIILIVNKPDWFEPQEMTYLGFDTDFSEMPFVESDCIRFDIKQTESQKYADETSKVAVDCPTAENRIYGQKKLLSFYVTGNGKFFGWNSSKRHYSCKKIFPYSEQIVTAKLCFPKKYLIKIAVEPSVNVTIDESVVSSNGNEEVDLGGNIQFTNINVDEESATTTDLYGRIIDRRDFYIEPHQIKEGTDGNYYVTLKMKNIRLISAEITNRPYKKVVPKCEFEGETNGKGTCYIVTNLRRPLNINIMTDSYVEICEDNGVTENVGLYKMQEEEQKFEFSGSNNFIDLEDAQPIDENSNNVEEKGKGIDNFSTSGGVNFGHNLSPQKLKYKLTNARLKSATLSNQLLRWYSAFEKTEDEVNAKGIILNNVGHATATHNANMEQYSDPCISTSTHGHYSTSDSVNGFYFNNSDSGGNQRLMKNAEKLDVYYSGGDCGGRILGTCKKCAGYTCKVTATCPQGYYPIIPTQIVSTHGDFDATRREGSFYYHVKPSRHKMAFITCTDNCYIADSNLSNGCYKDILHFVGQVKAYDFHPACYGIQKGKFIMTSAEFPDLSIIDGDLDLTIQTSGDKWTNFGYNLKDFIKTPNKYRVMDFSKFDHYSSDYVIIFTGRVKYKSSSDYSYRVREDVVKATGLTATFTGDSTCKETGWRGHGCRRCENKSFKLSINCPSGYQPILGTRKLEFEREGLGTIPYQINEDKLQCMVWPTQTDHFCPNGIKEISGPVLYGVSISGKPVAGEYVKEPILDNLCFKNWLTKKCAQYYNLDGTKGDNTCPESSDENVYSLTYTGDTSSNYRYDINNFFFLNSEPKELLGSISSLNNPDLLKNKGIYSYGANDGSGEGWLCFCGDGNLDVTFEMIAPYLTHYKANGSPQRKKYTKDELMIITPQTHKYVKQENGDYKIQFDVDGVSLEDLMFLQDPGKYICVPEDIPMPNNSRVKKYARSTTTSANLPNSTDNVSYDNFKDAFCYNNSNVNTFYLGNYNGDFFHITDDFEFDDKYALSQGSDYIYSADSTSQLSEHLGSGLYRYIRNSFTKNTTNKSFNWQINGLDNNKLLPILMTGVTLPINTALYYGASGTRDHVYTWQSLTNGTWNEASCGDSTAALRRLTSDAMQKLINTYANNLRIYTILYRKQPGDYSYLHGFSHGVYEINNESDLKTIMKAIAVDIKSWVGYREAHLVN